MAKIGIEQSLSDVRQTLEQKGHQIVELKQESDAKGCDCCVITGQDRNVMGIENTVTAGSVIQASGLSANDVANEVEQRLNR